VSPKLFGIGPDGIQWKIGNAPSGFHQCPLKSRPVGEPSPYPGIIQPQQGTCPTTLANYTLSQGVCVRTTGSAWDVRLCAGDEPTPATRKRVNLSPIQMQRLQSTKRLLAKKTPTPTPVKTAYVAPQPDYVTKGLSVLQSISSSLQGIATTLEPKPANTVVEPDTPISVSAYGGRRIVSSKQNKKGKKTRRRN